MKNKTAKTLMAFSIGLITTAAVLAGDEKLMSKEPAYKNMNSNKPAAAGLNSEALKVKTPEKLTSKEPAKGSMNSNRPNTPAKSMQKEPAFKSMNSNKPAAASLNSEDLKKKTPEKLTSKEPAK